MGLYTISHKKGYTRTGNSYRSNLEIVNKETLTFVAQRLGIEGVAKSHSKEKMAETISTFVLSRPEECLKQFSLKELLLLKDFVDEGADTSIVRPNRKYYDTLRELLFVSVYHDKKKRSLFFLLPDELRELFAPMIDKAIKEAKKREKEAKAVKPKQPAIKKEEPEYLDDADIDDEYDDDWDEDNEDGFVEEIIDMGHRHYDSLGEFLSHFNDHDYFDSVLAVQDFWHNANVVESKNAVVTLYATVVYTDQQTEKILYRSTEPIAVRIDTDDLNSITIPDLPSCCVSKFSTKVEVMDYSYGVLTIEGKDKNNSPFVVSLI
jgi:hypothetical protein